MESQQSALRRRDRNRWAEPFEDLHDDVKDTVVISSSRNKYSLYYSTFFVILALCAACYFSLAYVNDLLPTPLTLEDEFKNPHRFIATRAMEDIRDLTKLGPRPVGSFANEVLAVNVLNKKINNIMQRANEVHLIMKEDQLASGSFSLTFLEGMTNVYTNVRNIIVKIGPQIEAKNSILINCHYDSVADSPGGSDDAASCAVMLEVMRVMSLSNKPLINDIIFLFNGAEENLLQASHAFITQHKWSTNIKAFINIESCGSGGRELLFQAGPENPWLLEIFASSANHPSANTLAEEIFQSGLIPGDTDYRVFRDFGKIPGLDFAWTKNGYVYHTKLDTADHIPLGSLQNTGDNILPLINNLAQLHISDQLETEGNLVYFDIFGLCLVRVNENTSKFISVITLFTTLFLIFYQSSSNKAYNKNEYTNLVLKTFGIVCLSTCLSVISALAIAGSVIFFGRSMSWYSKPCWIFFLYVIPTITVFFNIIHKWVPINHRLFYRFNTKMLMLQLYVDVIALLGSIITFICLICNLRSGFLPTMWLIFLLLADYFRNFVHKKYQGSLWAYTYLAVMLFPFLMGCYIIDTTLHIVVPIMGRTGAGNFSEFLIAFMFSLMAILLLFFLIPLVVVVDHIKKIIYLFQITMVATVLALLLTPLGFPYSSNPIAPAPQRYMIIHTSSEVHTSTSMINYKSGFWIVNLDENSPHAAMKFVPELENAILVDECDKILYCGMPYLLPVRKFIWKTHWIPAKISQPLDEFSLTMSHNISYVNAKRLYFVVKGPDHITVMISPKMGAKILTWSFNSDTPLAGPKWNGRDTYFIYYSCGQNPQPWKFYIDFDVSNQTTSNFVDIAVAAHYLHGANQYNVRLNRLLAQFPPWTVTTGWTAAYKAYTF